MAKTGRPQSYTREIGDRVCQRIAGGESLRSISQDPQMPYRGTVIRWALSKDNAGFRHQFDTACQARAELWAEELVDLSDEAEDVQKTKLQIDTRKWVLSRVLSQRYGDKLAVEQSGTVNHTHTLDLTKLTPDQRSKLLESERIKRDLSLQNN